MKRIIVLASMWAIPACTTQVGEMQDDAEIGGSAGVATGGAAGSGVGGAFAAGGAGSDGGVGGIAGSAGAAGGGGGEPHVACADLPTQYTAALQKARACDPLKSAPQCTLQADNTLACPCLTWVNPEQADALGTMAEVRVQWAAFDCDDGECGLASCAQAVSAFCNASGVCEDIF